MSNQAIRNQRALAKCQSHYDNMQPPECWEDEEERIEVDEDEE